MGGTPAQGAQSQSQGAGAAPPFDLKDEAVVKQGATLFATTCSYCHKGHPGAGGAGVPTLRDQTYDKEYLYRMISDGPPSGRMPAWKYQDSAEQIWKRSEGPTPELQSLAYLVFPLLLEKKKHHP